MPDQSPAEEVRAAAALMRERARAATPGPWIVIEGSIPAVEQAADPQGDPGHLVAEMYMCGEPDHADRGDADAAHIAGMHPLLAGAVADWLDRFGEKSYCYGPAEFDHALAIARVYLGSPDA